MLIKLFNAIVSLYPIQDAPMKAVVVTNKGMVFVGQFVMLMKFRALITVVMD